MSQLPAIDFKARIERAVSALKGNALLVAAQPQAYRNSTVETSWRQDSLFYYLTGFSETEAMLLILSHREPGSQRVILFLRDKDPVAELWNGRRLGIKEAKSRLAIDEAYPIEELWTKLPAMLTGAAGLSWGLGLWPETDKKVIEALRKNRALNARQSVSVLPVHDTSEISAALRIKKDEREIARMRAAAAITRDSFLKVLSSLKPGLNERDVHATLLESFLRGGAEMEAYGSIVAAGNNACILHYRDNNRELKDGDLLLIDAGCQVDNYASDVTRTYPVNGKFTKAQRDLYAVCLKSQKDAINAAVPGKTWMDVQDAAFRSLARGLIDLGLITLPLAEAIEKNAHKKFCPHSISHWIGLDVHDAGKYMVNGAPVPFEPGMYFSVEPGIYIDENDETVPGEYRGIGIRIEDDVLITESGCEVLTAGIPKEISEIER